MSFKLPYCIQSTLAGLALAIVSVSCASKQIQPASVERSAKQNVAQAQKSGPQALPSDNSTQTPGLARAGTTNTPEVKPFFESSGETLNIDDEYEDDPVATAIIGEEVEHEIAKIPAGKANDGSALFDIPMVINQQVEKWIDYFQNRGRSVFAAWLSRSGKYVPMMQRILRENGLPQDLVYLSMIESGFKPYAYSRAKASGCWQFIHGTGSRYGLRNDSWIDERRDPEKSTIAAAQHLKDLYDQFNHWYLVAAGYNAGAGKIERAIARYSTEDFWEMSQYSYLASETKNYVPKMLAAAMIAKNPEKFGFSDVVYEEPQTYSKVIINKPVSLSAVSDKLNIPLADLKELNPELVRGMTPPHYPSYELKIPEGKEQLFAANLDEIEKTSMSVKNVRHVVRRGETLNTIARSYGMSSSELASMNGLRSKRVRKGQVLRVSFDPATIASRRSSKRSTKLISNRKHSESQEPLQYYKVRGGDTLWSIARKFNCTVTELRKWNGLGGNSSIVPGKKLRVSKRGPIKAALNESRTDLKVARARYVSKM